MDYTLEQEGNSLFVLYYVYKDKSRRVCRNFCDLAEALYYVDLLDNECHGDSSLCDTVIKNRKRRIYSSKEEYVEVHRATPPKHKYRKYNVAAGKNPPLSTWHPLAWSPDWSLDKKPVKPKHIIPDAEIYGGI